MTAAGTVPAAKFWLSVQELQVYKLLLLLNEWVNSFATDVRMASKEQVESLGGKFLLLKEQKI